MDQNNNLFNTQNSTNYPLNYQNLNNYQFQNSAFNQPQNIPIFSMAYVPNYRP
ncbi:BnaA08g03010D [Brassica napus]|uniref:BnaA08g03010D protein n=1 Tax=Brassica napus TaxID=3708 RepID=A0A078FTY6_BRANA|nr:BnaA08g03010D [Brassica napus]